MKLSGNNNAILIFFCLILITSHSYAQRDEADFQLSSPPNPGYALDSFFNKVVVVDNRYDTSVRLRVTEWKGQLVTEKWRQPLKPAIQAYVEQIIRMAKSTRNETLLLELRRYELNGIAMYFTANAYYNHADGGFVKIASMDTVFIRRWPHYMKGEAINLFLQEIVKRRQIAQIYPQAPIPVSAIDDNTVVNEWSKLPINTADSFPPGVYEFNKTFRKNQAEYFAMSIERQEDSVYAVSFTDSLPDNKKRIGNWLGFARGQGVISYEGKLYYLLDYAICLPLVKKNNTFYFHIPHALPNIYYLNEARYAETAPGPKLRDAGSPIIGIALVALDPAIRKSKINAINKTGERNTTLRDCYIDLDTGLVHCQ